VPDAASYPVRRAPFWAAATPPAASPA
jgi:hypothetical protein